MTETAHPEAITMSPDELHALRRAARAAIGVPRPDFHLDPSALEPAELAAHDAACEAYASAQTGYLELIDEEKVAWLAVRAMEATVAQAMVGFLRGTLEETLAERDRYRRRLEKSDDFGRGIFWRDEVTLKSYEWKIMGCSEAEANASTRWIDAGICFRDFVRLMRAHILAARAKKAEAERDAWKETADAFEAAMNEVADNAREEDPPLSDVEEMVDDLRDQVVVAHRERMEALR